MKYSGQDSCWLGQMICPNQRGLQILSRLKLVTSAKMRFQLKRRRAGTLSELVDSALLTAETIFFLVAPIENKGFFLSRICKTSDN